MEKNILSMITKNKFKAEPSRDLLPPGDGPDNELDFGCFKCENCTLCKNFLEQCTTFSSPKTKQIFEIKSRITCKTKYIIYIIFDKKCPEIFYIGYTEDNMTVRWRVHKSHIKKGHKSCEIATHFKSLANSTHKLDTTNQETFTSQLKEHLEICIIESVVPVPGIDIKATLKEREDFWQATLKSTTFFGGINKRSNRT